MGDQIDLGNRLISYGISNLNKSNFTRISYESGLKSFDEVLHTIKFCNTDCLSEFSAYEQGIFFVLTLNNCNPIAYSVIKREDIVDFQIEESIQVEVPKFNRYKAAIGGMIWAAGATGVIIGTFIEIQKNKKLDFKVIESKVEEGRRFTLKYKNSDGSLNEIIYVASENELAFEFENIIKKHWVSTYGTSKSSSGIGCIFIIPWVVFTITCFLL